jgi:probable F420-dependent oxidoreductase
MKIGLIPINMAIADAGQMVAAARKAEAIGVESLWTFEHVMIPIDYQSKYPYNATGKMGAPPETNLVDPLIALAAIASSTSKVRLATGVNILSQTNPLYLAKQSASLDFVSNGRFMLGVGIGWLREEFDALGVAFERRGARFDDYVQAMRKVWSGDVVEHQSEFLRWSGFKSYPIPIQRPGVPIIIGGSKGKAFERIAMYGDGWYAPTGNVAQLAELLVPLRKACAAIGRNPSSIEISAMWVPAAEGMDAVKRYADLGVSRLVVPTFAIGGAGDEALDRFGGEVLAKLV